MYRNKKGGLICNQCENDKLESLTHVLTCEGFDKERLNLEKQDDLIKYYREVMVFRDKMGFN